MEGKKKNRRKAEGGAEEVAEEGEAKLGGEGGEEPC